MFYSNSLAFDKILRSHIDKGTKVSNENRLKIQNWRWLPLETITTRLIKSHCATNQSPSFKCDGVSLLHRWWFQHHPAHEPLELGHRLDVTSTAFLATGYVIRLGNLQWSRLDWNTLFQSNRQSYPSNIKYCLTNSFLSGPEMFYVPSDC